MRIWILVGCIAASGCATSALWSWAGQKALDGEPRGYARSSTTEDIVVYRSEGAICAFHVPHDWASRPMQRVRTLTGGYIVELAEPLRCLPWSGRSTDLLGLSDLHYQEPLQTPGEEQPGADRGRYPFGIVSLLLPDGSVLHELYGKAHGRWHRLGEINLGRWEIPDGNLATGVLLTPVTVALDAALIAAVVAGAVLLNAPMVAGSGWSSRRAKKSKGDDRDRATMIALSVRGGRLGENAEPWTEPPAEACACAVGATACCARRCADGDAVSCYLTGINYDQTPGVPEAPEKAAAAYRSACEKGHLVGCTTVGVRQRKGIGTPADPDAATASFRRACDGGEPTGCTNLGFMITRASSPDYPRAVALFRKGCTGGHADGCLNLSIAYEKGLGITADLRTARRYHEMACKFGSQTACDRTVSGDELGEDDDWASEWDVD